MKFFRKKEAEPVIMRERIKVVHALYTEGLTQTQVDERTGAGYANDDIAPPTKTVGQIIRSNVITYFNIVFFILAGFLIAVGSWFDLTFMGVVITNIIIGIAQELKSKRTLDKMNIIHSPKAVVVRNGKEQTIKTHSFVRDDVAVFTAGSQIFADAMIIEGSCLANESLITGESNDIKKGEADKLVSGSFVVSGKCYARLTHVGADSYASKLTIEAKKQHSNSQGEMMRTLSKLVKWIGISLIPLGIAMCVKELVWLERSLQDSVVSTVGALVGMIPEGLYLLTSLALLTSIMRLIRKKTLVQEMACIETLARVDTFCVDKTGTITENEMSVESLVLLAGDRFIESDVELIMADYLASMQADNETMIALKKYFSGDSMRDGEAVLPFSSSKKFSAVRFNEDECYVLGAPDVILGEEYAKYQREIDKAASKGARVLLLTMYDGDVDDFPLDKAKLPIALVLLSNKVRESAIDSFRFFAQQGVRIKVISGDNHLTVSQVAKIAGIENSEKCVDARLLDTDEKIKAAAEKYTVFGRVTPEQKRKLVSALKENKHTVAMTGDGVNDVLALKEADCSIAMAAGSDVACRAANIVLLDSDFSSMPSVVMEGRRVINNIERSASLFLVKNIFSFVLAIITLFFTLPYPLTPAQLSLISTLTIGIPSFILAMEADKNMIKGKFLRNVLYRALPAAMTDLILVCGVLMFYVTFAINEDMISSICVIIMGIVGLLMLYRTSTPMNLVRKILLTTMSVLFLLSVILIPEIFSIVDLNTAAKLVLGVFALLTVPTFFAVCKFFDKLKEGAGRVSKKFTKK